MGGESPTCSVRNPAQGARGLLDLSDFVQPDRRGELRAWRQAEPDSIQTRPVRGPLANPAAANSSTMKGPIDSRGLVGESDGRRCQTANELSGWVRRRFYVRPPEMIRDARSFLSESLIETVPARESWTCH